MAVSGAYLAYLIRSNVQPFVRTYGVWVNEQIIPIVNDFERRAKAVEEQTYEQLSAQVNWEYGGDDYEVCEQAHDAALSFYGTLQSLYQATLNLLAAGLFHLIEQQLADIAHYGAIEKTVVDASLKPLESYYRDHLKIDLAQFVSWGVINEMRLVANATKHAEGHSAKEPRKVRPQMFVYTALRFEQHNAAHTKLRLPLGGDGLYVTADDFRRYERAANELFEFLHEQLAHL